MTSFRGEFSYFPSRLRSAGRKVRTPTFPFLALRSLKNRGTRRAWRPASVRRHAMADRQQGDQRFNAELAARFRGFSDGVNLFFQKTLKKN